ncbi:hypothetical protein EDB85DRAFT_1896815 [Lactarius pseudohatsudake]|nr:hypothetical protein EDB85DRAFT_1896815 [Lactarius pseudohatsudake]
MSSLDTGTQRAYTSKAVCKCGTPGNANGEPPTQGIVHATAWHHRRGGSVLRGFADRPLSCQRSMAFARGPRLSAQRVKKRRRSAIVKARDQPRQTWLRAPWHCSVALTRKASTPASSSNGVENGFCAGAGTRAATRASAALVGSNLFRDDVVREDQPKANSC